MTEPASEDARAARQRDAVLVARMAASDAGALAELYDRYARPVYSYLHRICGDPQAAEDLLQEVFFRAWRQAGMFDGTRGAFVSWVMSIAHNMAIDEVRKRRRRPQKADSEDPELMLASVPDTGLNVEDEVWLGALRETIDGAMATLPTAQREAIELTYFRGLTQREIAEQLGEPLGTIKTRMRLGMQKLRDQLEGNQGDLM